MFLNKLCKYFANIISNLCDNIPLNASNDSLNIYNKSCLNGFVLDNTSENEVSACVDNIKTNSAYGIVGTYSFKIGQNGKRCSILLSILFHFLKFPLSRHVGTSTYVLYLMLSVFSKIFEKILENKISKFINENHLDKFE